MRPTIAIPYWPGSNGDRDAIRMVREADMTPVPLYFHIGNEHRLEECAKILATEVDGAVIPGGFPYEDRLGFGVVPARIPQFRDAMWKLAESGRPLLAFCAGDQIAHQLGLPYERGSEFHSSLRRNIAGSKGGLASSGFLDAKIYTRLECPPERTAFTRMYLEGEVVRTIIDHGGGRFWADDPTLAYIQEHGLAVTRYSDEKGNITDAYPVNPNGSMLSIESLTNRRGNLKVGMAHNERFINALQRTRHNLVFRSMREFIEDGCPDLSGYAVPQRLGEPRRFEYLAGKLDDDRTIDVYVRMLTDDNEAMTAQLFLGCDGIERRRLIRAELTGRVTPEVMQRTVLAMAEMDFLDGIMLKKDLPTVAHGGHTLTYEVVDRRDGRVVRDFVESEGIVDGHPFGQRFITKPNPDEELLLRRLHEHPYLAQSVRRVETGTAWFFRDEETRDRMTHELL